MFKGETATQKEGNEIVAPVLQQVDGFVNQHTVFVNTILRHIGPHIRAPRCDERVNLARIKYLDHGARFGLRWQNSRKLNASDSGRMAKLA